MRYRVLISPMANASQVASGVAYNHGNWGHAVNGVGDIPGIVFIDANDGEDDDLIREFEDHADILEYTEVDTWPEKKQWSPGGGYDADSQKDISESVKTFIGGWESVK